MVEAGHIAYELIGSRRKNDEEATPDGNYYHWKIKLICAVCRDTSIEMRYGWQGDPNCGHREYTVKCKGCDTKLVARENTGWWLSQAEGKNPNVLAVEYLKHYPR